MKNEQRGPKAEDWGTKGWELGGLLDSKLPLHQLERCKLPQRGPERSHWSRWKICVHFTGDRWLLNFRYERNWEGSRLSCRVQYQGWTRSWQQLEEPRPIKSKLTVEQPNSKFTTKKTRNHLASLPLVTQNSRLLRVTHQCHLKYKNSRVVSSLVLVKISN